MFVVLVVLSHYMLMWILGMTTYHAYFWKWLPALLLHSVAVAWILYALRLPDGFLWILGIEALWLFAIGRKQAKQADEYLSYSADDAETIRNVAWSIAKTRTYYTYSSLIYLGVFSVSYLWLYNR